ncbi:MAG: ORF6N domain-containing protein [Candidatus Margulisiibacteriota bacterium]
MPNLVPIERIENKILLIRGQKVILDKDLAELYGVRTREINKAVTRNRERFPKDFSFKLSKQEFNNLMFQIGTSSWGGTRKLPRVFTEQGVAMLSSVLKSRRAVLVNIAIMRAFVRLRQLISSHKELARKIEELERKFGGRLEKHDHEIVMIFEAIKKLMLPPEEPPRKRIGFIVDQKGGET